MNDNVHFKKYMSTFSLMMTGVTSIVGSGWLLATQKISNVAGPAGILAWAVGAFVAILIALFCIEIGTVKPSAGGIGYYSTVTHGRFSGFLTQWINWLSIMPVPAIEAQAIVQYLSEASPMCHSWYDLETHGLTHIGVLIGFGFMLLFMFINYYGLKIYTRFNNTITVIKICIPILTIVCLIYSGVHPSNFGTDIHTFAPFGWNAVITAVISCGVIMSFNGFQTPLSFSEEIKSPHLQLPVAIIGGIILTFVLYVALQMIFIGSIDPAKVAAGWNTINFRSPYVNLLLIANLQLMSWAVMSTSVIAPAACGAAFSASAARMLYTLSRAKVLPKFLSQLDPNYFTPRMALIVNMVFGCMFLLAFKGWSDLVGVVSVLHIFSYLAMPIVVVAFRRQKHAPVGHNHNFRLPFAPVFAIIVLFILSVLLFFAAWPHIGELALLVLPGLIFFFYYEAKNFKETQVWPLVKGGLWLIYFFLGISLISYLGNNKLSGVNLIDTKTSMVLLAILSITSFIYGVYSSNKTIVE